MPPAAPADDDDGGVDGAVIAGAVCGPMFGLLGLGGWLYIKSQNKGGSDAKVEMGTTSATQRA
eukprot:390265-Prymnesium_polylepis.1